MVIDYYFEHSYSSFIELSEYNGCENPSILKQLDKKITKAKRLNIYDKNNDIWSIGCICYEMLMGISLLNEGKMEKILQKIKNGNYTIPMTISYEIISFINGMLDKKKDERLNYYGLIKHDFFTKDVNEFKKMELRLSEKIFSGTFNIDDLSTGSIWRIFNEKDDALLKKLERNESTINMNHKLNTKFDKLLFSKFCKSLILKFCKLLFPKFGKLLFTS